MWNVNVNITSSKVFAFYAFTVAAVYSFVNSDPLPMTAAIPSAVTLLGAKIYKDIKTKNKEIQ